ncbi:MAG TPA: lysophospholipid acyltransferase family protein [Verrucomicrobiae bacterium]
MNLRAAGRICWFAFEVTGAIFNYFFTAAFAPEKSKRLARAAWLHRASRRHLRIFNYSAVVAGPVPQNGLLVTNHLSYLDVLAISAVTPAVFVAKSEIRGWPLFGWLAALAGTVFVERERRTQVGAVNREIQNALDEGALVVLFPEGTSTNGEDVLPFRSSLLEPATTGAQPIAIGCLHYEIEDGDACNEICWWGNRAFFPHLLNLAGKKSIRATLRFAKFERTTNDRKELAKQLREAVLELKRAYAPHN